MSDEKKSNVGAVAFGSVTGAAIGGVGMHKLSGNAATAMSDYKIKAHQAGVSRMYDAIAQKRADAKLVLDHFAHQGGGAPDFPPEARQKINEAFQRNGIKALEDAQFDKLAANPAKSVNFATRLTGITGAKLSVTSIQDNLGSIIQQGASEVPAPGKFTQMLANNRLKGTAAGLAVGALAVGGLTHMLTKGSHVEAEIDRRAASSSSPQIG